MLVAGNWEYPCESPHTPRHHRLASADWSPLDSSELPQASSASSSPSLATPTHITHLPTPAAATPDSSGAASPFPPGPSVANHIPAGLKLAVGLGDLDEDGSGSPSTVLVGKLDAMSLESGSVEDERAGVHEAAGVHGQPASETAASARLQSAGSAGSIEPPGTPPGVDSRAGETGAADGAAGKSGAPESQTSDSLSDAAHVSGAANAASVQQQGNEPLTALLDSASSVAVPALGGPALLDSKGVPNAGAKPSSPEVFANGPARSQAGQRCPKRSRWRSVLAMQAPPAVRQPATAEEGGSDSEPSASAETESETSGDVLTPLPGPAPGSAAEGARRGGLSRRASSSVTGQLKNVQREAEKGYRISSAPQLLTVRELRYVS